MTDVMTTAEAIEAAKWEVLDVADGCDWPGYCPCRWNDDRRACISLGLSLDNLIALVKAAAKVEALKHSHEDEWMPGSASPNEWCHWCIRRKKARAALTSATGAEG